MYTTGITHLLSSSSSASDSTTNNHDLQPVSVKGK